MECSRTIIAAMRKEGRIPMAIKIIKPGKFKSPKDTRRFLCLNCGCVFDADRGDYEAFTICSQPDDVIVHQAI